MEFCLRSNLPSIYGLYVPGRWCWTVVLTPREQFLYQLWRCHFRGTKCYSIAFVVRDHEGKLVEARSTCLRGNPTPDLAETVSIREVLSWIKREQYCNTMMESDCLQVVQAIRSPFLVFSYLGEVVNECKVLLAELKNKNITFRFVKRTANKVAHFLARQNCSEADRIWRVGDVHSDSKVVLSNDLLK